MKFWTNFVSLSPNCANPPNSALLHTPHFSMNADFNNDCVSDLFLTLDSTSPALLIALNSSDNRLTYCLTDLSSTYMDKLSGHMVGDFNQDGLLDIAGFNEIDYVLTIYYNQLSNPVVGKECNKIMREDNDKVLAFT